VEVNIEALVFSGLYELTNN